MVSQCTNIVPRVFLSCARTAWSQSTPYTSDSNSHFNIGALTKLCLSHAIIFFISQSYLMIVSATTFIATIKSLKLLRFNKNMNILGYTMLRIAQPLLMLFVAMVTVFIAYSHMAFLVYNSLLLEFGSFLNSIFTLFTLMLSE